MKGEMREEEQKQNSPEFPSSETSFRQTLEFVSALIVETHATKVFPVKWQLIRSKLDRLNSDISNVLNCNSGKNSLFSDLITVITLTLHECRNLARRCTELTYSGKLLMQSDLDAVSGKFELHLQQLSGIYTAGILTNSYAIVVSRPVSGASREEMRFFVKDLFTRLQIGNLEMKTQALITMNEILQEDEKYVKIVAQTGDLNLLVKLLEYEENEIQEQCAGVVSAIAGFDSSKNILVAAGIVGVLVRVLEIGSDLGKERAARALMKLTVNSDNVWSVSAHGGLTALLKLCIHGNSEAVGAATGTLRNLAAVDEIKRFMVEEGVIYVMLKLLRSGDEVSRIYAAESLQIMASGDEITRQTIVREGGIQSLVSLLDSDSSKSRETALRSIRTFCFSPNSVNALISSGFLDLVLDCLRNGEFSVQELAVKAVCDFSKVSDEIKKFIGDSGFIPELVKLLDAKSSAIREIAAEAISILVAVPKNRKKFVQEEENVNRILQLLDPESERSGKKFLFSALMSITSSNTGRKKIAASRSVQNLERLAENEVTEAKRIVRKLSGNRFWNTLNGIWNS